MEASSSGSGSGKNNDKPLSIGQAAFLLLRVRRVFKKKLATKKEKNTYTQDLVFPKPDLSQVGKSKKSRSVPPLIRSRTVPAIIVPFSILQAHLVKASGCGSGAGASSSNANGPGTSSAGSSHHSQPQASSKSDFATPGIDYLQFLTGSGSPSSSVAGTPPSHRRESYYLGLSNPSIYNRDSSSDSSWNVKLCSTGNLSTSTTCNVSPSSGGDAFNGNHISPSFVGGNPPGPTPTTSSSGSRGLARFARLLNSQAPKSHSSKGWNQYQQGHLFPSGSGTGTEVTLALGTPRLLRRRRSLENEDLTACRPRAVSIDSLLRNQKLLAPPGADGKGLSPKRYSTCSAGPSIGHRVDQRLNEGFVVAVELGNVAKVKNYLETADVDINSLTSDGLTLLDVAVMQRNRPMVKLLLGNGATENQYWTKESINDQLEGLVQEAEKKSGDLMARLLKCSTFGNLSPAQLKELEKEFHLWEKRYKKFRKMRTEYTQIRPPDAPLKSTLDVIGPSSVKIRIQEDESGDNSISTKYKIEWSRVEDFKAGELSRVLEIFDLRKMETILNDLKSGTRYYFRVACGNCTGYGPYLNTTPISVIPSSWRDIDERRGGRYTGKSSIFDSIFTQIREARPDYASEIRTIDFPNEMNMNLGPSSGSLSSQQQKKNQKIISIKQLFASAPKFQKNFKRGVFLSCVMYSEDKLLVTTEEFLPTIEIDETFPSTLHTDFHWLLKVACTWEDVKSLKQDMEKSGSASTFHFRLKLLQAAAAMQSALGVGDLGRLYYKTIRDKSSSVLIISTVNYFRSTKMISSLNVRWAPVTKMSSRKATDDISDVLINSIQEQILYHQVSNIPLGKGLYLGYLKLASSVEVLKIVVPEKTPNILPHAKIRDNPHVSSEEWSLIQKMVKSKSTDSLNYDTNSNNVEDRDRESSEEMTTSSDADETLTTPNISGVVVLENEFTEAQELFRTQVNSALKKLFSYLEIDYEASMSHRLYTAEVVEVNNSVSMIVVYPALENVCLVAGQSDKLLTRNDLIPLPIQVFEMIHLNTYQKDFITRYARLSAILEVDTILAQHNQREAFSAEEVALAKQRLNQLQAFQTKLDANWKGARWVIDLVTTSRDKASPSASIKALAQFDLQTSSESIVSADACVRKSEEAQFLGLHSKSDQQLRLFGSTLGTSSAGIKFSKSENQLANLGLNSPTIDDRSKPSTCHHLTHRHLLNTRKVSMPLFAKAAVGDKLQFNPKIYSTHSQSDSTISHSASSGEQVSSASLHNLFRHSSSSQLPVPSVVVSQSSDSTPTTIPPVPIVKPPPALPRPAAAVMKSHQRISGEPPPVPPRRTLPPPPPARLFPALDPPAQPPPVIPTVQVNLCDSPRSWSGSSTSCASGSGPPETVSSDPPPPSPSPTSSSGVMQTAYECGLSVLLYKYS